MFRKLRKPKVTPAIATTEGEVRVARGELAMAINELDRTKHRLEQLMISMLSEVASSKRDKL